jgi:transposase InsO family protein
MVAFIDDHREKFGVEPICGVLPIAPSVYYQHKVWQRAPERRPARAQRDEGLCPHVRRVWDENKQVYGPRKVWKQMKREQHTVARCTVERLMRRLGLRGVRRGGYKPVTTVPDSSQDRPGDLVNRDFRACAPNRLWVVDFTYC